MKGKWIEIKAGRDNSPIIIMAKQTQLGEITLIYYKSNQSRIMRNETFIITHLFPTPPFFLGLILLLIFSTSSTPAALLSPVWGLSHRKQFSINFSKLSPSQRQQFITNWSSVGSFHWGAVLQKHTLQSGSLLQWRLFFPWALRSCQDLLLHRHPTVSYPPSGIQLLHVVFSRDCR